MRKPEVDKPGKQYGVVEYRAPQQKIARKLTPHLPFFMRVASGRPVTDADHCKAEVEGQKPALGWSETFPVGVRNGCSDRNPPFDRQRLLRLLYYQERTLDAQCRQSNLDDRSGTD